MTAAPNAGAREWTALAVLALPTVLLAMDLTVLHLAVPQLSAALRPTSTQLLWIVDVYGFLVAGLLITMGGIGDRIGRRRLLMIGSAAFAATSVLAAFAPTPGLLIAARALLGVAGATLMPSTLALVKTIFTDARQQGFAVALWMASFLVGAALGPLVGGVLLEWFWWGSVFLLGLPVMALLLVTGPLLLPESRDAAAHRVDVPSVALSLAAVLSTVYGLKAMASGGTGADVVAVTAGVALGAAFLHRQRRLAHPLLDLALFSNRTFSVALGAQAVLLFAMGGMQLFVLQHLQLVLGLSPLQAGLWTLPSTGLALTGVVLAPALATRVRPAVVISSSLVVATAALAVLARVEATSSLPLVIAAFAVMSLGFAPLLSLGAGLVIGSAPVERAGAASALQETGGELGVSLGLALLGSAGAAAYRAHLDGALPPSLPRDVVEAAQGSLGAALFVAREVGGPIGDELLTVARDAFTAGLRLTALLSAALAACLAVVVSVGLRHVPPRGAATPSDGEPQAAYAVAPPAPDAVESGGRA